MNLSPIVLFTYNRPQHTQKTLEALSRNHLADQSTLYIYCDGPKPDASEETIRNIEEVRSVVKSNQWCKEVKIIESDVNKGLAKSIVNGVTEVVNAHKKVIVLEDDLVSSKGYLSFMNKCLDLYQDDPRVMHVTGYMDRLRWANLLPDTFFLYSMYCLGWGTWKRAWDHLIFDYNVINEKLKQIDLINFDNIKMRAQKQINRNLNGEINTWAIAWYSSIYLSGGYCLCPSKSLLRNIGHDGSGHHCPYNELLLNQPIANQVPVKKQSVIVSKDIENILLYFRSPKNRGLQLLKVRSNLFLSYLKVYLSNFFR